MREIKFRAWDAVMDFMVDVDYYKIDFKGQVFFDNDDKSLYNQTDKLILMQYTGLKDKNGVEIYEGDIIKKEKDIVVIKYSEYHTSFQVYYNISISSKTSLYEFGYSKELEIIGNIYENPELPREY